MEGRVPPPGTAGRVYPKRSNIRRYAIASGLVGEWCKDDSEATSPFTFTGPSLVSTWLGME